MKKTIISSALAVLSLAGSAFAAGPYAPTNWPPTIDPTKIVHYFVTDGAASFTVPNANWTNSLFHGLNSGDQVYAPQQICGPNVTFTGDKATVTYINIADSEFTTWNTMGTIDILVQVYGDATLLTSPTAVKPWGFRTSTSPSSNPLIPGSTITIANGYPTNVTNFKWNWILFSITNKLVGGTGPNRYVGSIPPGSGATGTNYGGLAGGTIRFGTLPGVIIHAVAFGEAGAFGTTNDINLFEPADGLCDPVPNQNLVGIDFNAGFTNNLQVMDDLDQTVTFTNSIGPVADKRKAVIPVGNYLNFGILSNYLGKPCNPNTAIKICVDFYDDPALAGASFGPESYAADQSGGACAPNVLYPTAGLYTLTGTDKWIRKSWTVPGVNLYGVNTTPLTGGPRFWSVGGQVAVSRFEMAALRTTGPLAGLDPLVDCRPDPLVCEDAYGNYAEWDLQNSIANGLDLGNNTGDQTYVTEMAGPAGDQRMSVRNADGASQYLNFKLVGDPFGPVAQGNCALAIAVTYFDDPELAGKGLRAQTWTYESAGAVVPASLSAPQDNIILQGSNVWREAYWQIGRITFNGVNQSPAATRFATEFGADTTKKIHISRVRYAVIRDCGTNAGVNLLATNFIPFTIKATADTNGLTKLSWPYKAPQAELQGVSALGSTWVNYPTFNRGVLTVEGGETRVFNVTNSSAERQFFRLRIPNVP